MEELYQKLEERIDGLPTAAEEVAILVAEITRGLDPWSPSGQMGNVMLSYLRGLYPDCKKELRQWVAELRQPNLRQRYALPGSPPPLPGPPA